MSPCCVAIQCARYLLLVFFQLQSWRRFLLGRSTRRIQWPVDPPVLSKQLLRLSSWLFLLAMEPISWNHCLSSSFIGLFICVGFIFNNAFSLVVLYSIALLAYVSVRTFHLETLLALFFLVLLEFTWDGIGGHFSRYFRNPDQEIRKSLKSKNVKIIWGQIHYQSRYMIYH